MPADCSYVTGDAAAAGLVVELTINSVLNPTTLGLWQRPKISLPVLTRTTANLFASARSGNSDA
jgi:hypothetical protein